MGWRDNKYYYSTKTLRTIAENYISIYNGLELREGHLITNPWALAEFRADFDMALNGIGRGHWTGNISGGFKDYQCFGRLQRIIIADIMGLNDYELIGFWSIPRLRGYAYYLMAMYLNGGIDINKEKYYNISGGE